MRAFTIATKPAGPADPWLLVRIGTTIQKWFLPVNVDLFAQGTAALYENGQGYRAPWRIHGDPQLGRKPRGRSARASRPPH